jgi:hypothetical protein
LLVSRFCVLQNGRDFNKQTTSRVIEPQAEALSANLVGEAKVDRGNRWFSPMCAGSNTPERIKSPLMAFAAAIRHDAFTSYSVKSGQPRSSSLEQERHLVCALQDPSDVAYQAAHPRIA